MDGIAGAPGYRQSIGDKFAWDVLPLPKGPKGHGSTLSGDGWWIKKDVKAPAAAWELVKRLTGEEHQRAQLQAASLYPSLKRLVPDYFRATSVKNQDAVVLTAEQIGIPFPVTPSFSRWTGEILAPALADVWNNKKTPREAMGGIAAQVNALLAEDARSAKL
jgi:ABC-type glycerol-3-phosphate transport system substrate-binding protein